MRSARLVAALVFVVSVGASAVLVEVAWGRGHVLFPLSPRAAFVGGPVFSGADPVWAESEPDGDLVVRRTAGELVSTLAVGRRYHLERYFRSVYGSAQVFMAASRSEISAFALATTGGVEGADVARVADFETGPASGPLSALMRCGVPGGVPCHQPVDNEPVPCGVGPPQVAGNVVGYRDHCQNAFFVRDFSPGADPSPRGLFAFGDRPGYVLIAGPYAAIVTLPPFPVSSNDCTAATIKVIDRHSGDTLYQLATSIEPLVDRGTVSLQDDGTVAFLIAPPSDASCQPAATGVGWASIADPRLHAVPGVLPAGFASIRLANNRIAIATPLFGGADRRHGSLTEDTYTVYDLSGNLLASAAGWRNSDPSQYLAGSLGGVIGWDFNGTQLSWEVDPCARPSIAVWDLSAAPPPSQGDGCEPIQFKPTAFLSAVKRRFTITGTCPANPPAGCDGWASIQRVGDPRHEIAHFTPLMAPKQTITWHPRIAARALRLLLRSRAREVRILLETSPNLESRKLTLTVTQ